ncbi:unnamed protein product [Paramecium pentaurelia]|uniref:Transmembrane protein n=1 Tax=Paramecium pentaurelia TaxID=43138 RepID=A0A8S1SSQ6_9CILI|nr:unnamed protein product [Paramecium pentaurelia]
MNIQEGTSNHIQKPTEGDSQYQIIINKEQEITRQQLVIKLQDQNIKFTVPDTEEAQELTFLLEQKQKLQNPLEPGYVEQFFQKYYEFEERFNLFFTCSPKKYKITFDLNQFIITIVYWSTFFSVLSESIAIENSSIIQNDKIRQQIAHQLPVYAFLYTISSQICQQINKNLIWILLFIFLIIIPSLVLVGYHLNLFGNYDGFSQDYIGVGYCIVSIAIFINSLINRGFLYFIKKVSSAVIATLFNCSFCVLVSYFILFKIVAFILLIQSVRLEYIIDNITSIIAPSTFLVILFFSIFLLKGLFNLPKKTIKYDLYQLSLLKYADQDIKNEYPNYKMNKKAINIFGKLKLQYIVPILIAICYATIEIFCYANLIIGLQTYDFEQIITFGFLLLAIPIFIIFGICISNTRFKRQNLYLYTPLLLGAVFSVICIKVWSVTIENEYIKSISRLIGICPLIISLMWLTVGFFRSEKRNQKLFVMLFSCYSFALPFGIFLTFSEYFDDFGLEIGAYVLASIGLIPILLLIIYYIVVVIIYLIKLPKQAENLQFIAFEYINLKNYAIWYNSICYVISFYLICYFAWNEPITATGTKKGTIIGLLSIHSVLFILTSNALSIEVKEQTQQDIDEQQNLTYSQKFKNRMQDSTTVGIILPFIVLLPIGLSVDSEVAKNALLANSIGIPLSFLYYKFQISLKQESFNYQLFIQPLVVILGWTFIIGPIGTVFPIVADYFENSSPEFALFAQLAVAYSILIIIISVTVLSIFYSVLLNKEQLEMKKKEVLKKVMSEFADNGVYATEEISSLLFVRFVQHRNSIKLEKDLIKGDPINMYEHPEPSENNNIKNILVTKQDYENKMKLEQIQESKRQKIRQSFSANYTDIQSQTSADTIKQQNQEEHHGILSKMQDCLFSCFLCRFGYYDLEQIELNENNKKKDLEEIEKFFKIEQDKINKRTKIRREKRQSTYLVEDPKLGDEYKPIKEKHQHRVERFWIAVYNLLLDQGDFSKLLEILALEKDYEILKQYESFEEEDDKFTISEEDFALLIYDNFKDKQNSYSDILQTLAQTNFFYLIKLYPELYKFITKFKNAQSAIQYENLKQSQKFNDERQCLVKIKIHKNELDEQQQENEQLYQKYKLKLQETENKYKIKTPHDYEKWIWNACKSIHTAIWITPKKYTQNLMNQLADLYSKIAPIQPKPNPISEDWTRIAPKICNCLVDEFNRFDRKANEQEFHFQITITNCLAVVLRIYDLYGLITLAFDSQVGWFGDGSQFKPIKTVDYSAIWSEYNFFFFMALLMSIAYIVLGLQASKQIADNSFGYNEDGSIAGIKSLRFWLSKTIQIISGQFIFVMKTYIDAFICDYSEYPYILVRQPSVECMSDLHFLYITLAIVGCGIYYPLSTYLQPTFQFMDRSLDLKYKSNFVVLYIQAKLLILGSSSVFSNLQESAYLYQMLFSFLVMGALIYFHFRLDPSYIKWFNVVDRCLLLILCYFYFGAFVILVSKNILVGWVITLIFTVSTLIYLTYFLIKERINYKNKQQTQVRPIEFQQTHSIRAS